jgi:VWFA-related protein
MTRHSQIASVLVLTAALAFCSSLRSVPRQQPADAPKESRGDSSLNIPNRPATPRYSGEQGDQRSEIKFAPLTRVVTAKIHVEDPNGYFLPNLRPDNFAVYEDGVHQKNVNVEIERAPVSIALVLEFGGRYHELNKKVAMEMPEIGRHLLEVLGRDDKVAIFKFASNLETLADFDHGRASLDGIFEALGMPETSEVNLYDSLLQVLERMRSVPERKAVIVVSSGVDNFSKANFSQMLESARTSAVPIYTIGLGHLMELEAVMYGDAAPFARINWTAAEKQLESLSKVSGGRSYALESDAQIPGIYDDIMENLRVRYVVTYVSSNTATVGPPRSIRIELVNPKTGAPLKIHDATGKLIPAKVFVQAAYNPTSTTPG